MQLVQWYDTTVTDRDQAVAARFLAVPARAAPNPELVTDLAVVTQRLGLVRLRDLSSSTFLPSAFLAILQSETADDAAQRLQTLLTTSPDQALASTGIDPQLRAFVEHLAFARLIPFETSPVDLASLATILTTGSGVAIGAYAGMVASGGTPLILVTVPVGIILGGAAAGIGKALEEGLHERLLNWVRRRSDDRLPKEKLEEVVHAAIEVYRMSGRRVTAQQLVGELKQLVSSQLNHEKLPLPDDDRLTATILQLLPSESSAPDPSWLLNFVNEERRKKGFPPLNFLGDMAV